MEPAPSEVWAADLEVSNVPGNLKGWATVLPRVGEDIPTKNGWYKQSTSIDICEYIQNPLTCVNASLADIFFDKNGDITDS